MARLGRGRPAALAVLAIALAVAVGGCGLIPGSDSSSPTPGAYTACVIPPSDFESVVRSLEETDALECYGDAELTFDAAWTGGPGGAIDCPPVEPEWFSCQSSVMITRPEGVAAVVLAATTGPNDLAMWVAVHPDSEIVRDQPWQGDARITGHFDDPAAQTCRYVVDSPDLPVSEAIDTCRHTFVVTALERGSP